MTDFKTSKIFLDSETISEQLRSVRQERGLKLNAIAKKLNINVKHLEALEKNQFDKLPQGAYGKNFLREYAAFLGLDYQEMVKMFSKETSGSDADKHEELFSHKVVGNLNFFAIPKILRNLLVLGIVVVCFSYLGYRIQLINSVPVLTIEAPAENLIVTTKAIEVRGTTEPETNIIINGETVLTDDGGRFTKEVYLKSGMNAITIVAKKKYGKEHVITRQILVKDNELQL